MPFDRDARGPSNIVLGGAPWEGEIWVSEPPVCSDATYCQITSWHRLTKCHTHCAGYMRLNTRKLVLRQIAHARGLIARAQEDPTYHLPGIWRTVSCSSALTLNNDLLSLCHNCDSDDDTTTQSSMMEVIEITICAHFDCDTTTTKN